jgi:uncharacterized protein (DUF2249 family)/iron-sulfur cluster repair protein YtfE (RIC family)
MQTVTMATNADDAATLERLEQLHAELSGSLETLVRTLLAAIGGAGDASLQGARDDLTSWCRDELQVHLELREAIVYPAVRQVERLEPLLRSLLHEHGLISSLIVRVSREADPAVLAAEAGALRTVVTSHLAKEQELVLPALAADAQVSLTELVTQSEAMAADTRADLAAATGPVADQDDARSAVEGHTCGCHEDEHGGYPELDARAVPHAIRHATVFGALDGLSPGAGLILVAPHDPLPLLAQIEQRWPDSFAVSYRERGPEAWRLLFLRNV